MTTEVSTSAENGFGANESSEEKPVGKSDMKKNEVPLATDEQVDNPAAPDFDPSSEPMIPMVEYERVKAERDQFFDRLARLQAEFDNARKREAKERADFRDYSLGSTVEQFLPVLDNFQLALKSEGTTEQLRTGVDLIVKQMEEILRGIGVQSVPTVGESFDPRVHEALELVERTDVPDQQVIDEVRRGYTIRERLLRPALVRVASNSSHSGTTH